MKAAARSLTILLLAFILVSCSSLARHKVRPNLSCESLNGHYVEAIDDSWSEQPRDGVLRVPVAIHLMTDHDGPIKKRPEVYWTPAVVRRYFGTGNLSANAIWAQAAIQFDLRLVERCFYDPPQGTFTVDEHKIKVMLLPAPTTLRNNTPADQRTIIEHYLNINTAYGISRTVNVYLWTKLQDARAYGESPRRGRIEVEQRGLEPLATVWMESEFACGSDPDECQLTVAHELGHALGLAHSCRMCNCCENLCWVPRDYYYNCGTSDSTSLIWKDWCPCEGTPGEAVSRGLTVSGEPLECCGNQHKTLERLMFPDVSAEDAGAKLSEGEIHSARSAVREFFYKYPGGFTWRSRWIR